VCVCEGEMRAFSSCAPIYAGESEVGKMREEESMCVRVRETDGGLFKSRTRLRGRECAVEKMRESVCV